ncbi:DUF6370 family protein [Flavobacterium taihuense]|uniref:Glutaminyl-tRNA synthetase n=1 Tax=Flavobacterium taihuense TaxID=2857508 RepID=A0ABS6XUV7_9FLAO|nr:DUF6370 family protein [Flavobacterium taihuense]MBW4359659.1 hypothetical protein [Flavobacterium taihuense]
MKNIFVFALLFATLISSAQDKKKLIKSQIVEVSCGECQFGMKGKSCDLAVRIDGKAYFVDGTKIDDHGNAHAKDGFCETIRKAEVTGEIVNNRFKVTSFTLLPEQK